MYVCMGQKIKKVFCCDNGPVLGRMHGPAGQVRRKKKGREEEGERPFPPPFHPSLLLCLLLHSDATDHYHGLTGCLSPSARLRTWVATLPNRFSLLSMQGSVHRRPFSNASVFFFPLLTRPSLPSTPIPTHILYPYPLPYPPPSSSYTGRSITKSHIFQSPSTRPLFPHNVWVIPSPETGHGEGIWGGKLVTRPPGCLGWLSLPCGSYNLCSLSLLLSVCPCLLLPWPLVTQKNEA